MTTSPSMGERPVGRVRGTRDWLAEGFGSLLDLEAALAGVFARSGYQPIRIPILEFTDLHERKSGAGVISKLYELDAGQSHRVCLRPELTAGVVRAYVEAPEPLPIPCRVRVSGPVFRHETMRPGFDREFHQVGVELLGAGGAAADAEVVWLAWSALDLVHAGEKRVRIGHVGLILEMLERSGLPESARATLIERLSEAAADGGNIDALEQAFDQFAGWISSDSTVESDEPPVPSAENSGVDRLFRTLVPDVTGRRSGREILGRLRRKWDLGHSLHAVLERLMDRVRELSALRGNAREVLPRLEAKFADLAPETVANLRSLIELLDAHGLDAGQIDLDFGFGRGIGFYSQMVFELVVGTDRGLVEVCVGGRYDGLARVLGSDRDARGVGFAFGLERLRGVVGRSAPRRSEPSGFLVLPAGPDQMAEGIRLARSLRDRGETVVLDEDTPDLDEQARRLTRHGLRYVALVDGNRDGSGSPHFYSLTADGEKVRMPLEGLRVTLPRGESDI